MVNNEFSSQENFQEESSTHKHPAFYVKNVDLQNDKNLICHLRQKVSNFECHITNKNRVTLFSQSPNDYLNLKHC